MPHVVVEANAEIRIEPGHARTSQLGQQKPEISYRFERQRLIIDDRIDAELQV